MSVWLFPEGCCCSSYCQVLARIVSLSHVGMGEWHGFGMAAGACLSAGCVCAAVVTWELSGSKYKNKPKFLQFSLKLAASFPWVLINTPSVTVFPQSQGFILLSPVINGAGDFSWCFPWEKQEWAVSCYRLNACVRKGCGCRDAAHITLPHESPPRCHI